LGFNAVVLRVKGLARDDLNMADFNETPQKQQGSKKGKTVVCFAQICVHTLWGKQVLQQNVKILLQKQFEW